MVFKTISGFIFLFLLQLQDCDATSMKCNRRLDGESCIYDYLDWRLRCDGRNIKTLPTPDRVKSDAPPGDGRVILANGNCIEKIKQDTFKHYRKARHINLNMNQIQIIVAYTFINCEELHNVTIADNAIHTIQQYAFAGLTNLAVIDLSGNSIMSIEEHSFDDLGSLRELYLSRNEITTIHPDAFSSVANLRILDLSANALRTLTWTSTLIQLRVLNVSHNQLSEFDGSGLELYPKITNLDLRNNQIGSINNSAHFREREFMYVILANNQLTYPDPDWFRSSAHNAAELTGELSFVEGNPWNCECANDYYNFLTKDIRKPKWRNALDIQCRDGKKLGTFKCDQQPNTCNKLSCPVTPNENLSHRMTPTTTTITKSTTSTTPIATTTTTTTTRATETTNYRLSPRSQPEPPNNEGDLEYQVHLPPKQEENKGEDVSVTNKQDQTTLHVIVISGCVTVVSLAAICTVCMYQSKRRKELKPSIAVNDPKTGSTRTAETLILRTNSSARTSSTSSSSRSATSNDSIATNNNREKRSSKSDDVVEIPVTPSDGSGEKEQLLLVDKRSITAPKQVGSTHRIIPSSSQARVSTDRLQPVYQDVCTENKNNGETVAKTHAAPTAVVRPMTSSASEGSLLGELPRHDLGVPEADADVQPV